MGPARFRKKPVVVEAIQFDGSLARAALIVDWVCMNGGTARAHDVYQMGTSEDGSRPIFVCGGIHIDTLEGVMNLSDQDWAIRGTEGEFYPCKPAAFAATFESVESVPLVE